MKRSFKFMTLVMAIMLFIGCGGSSSRSEGGAGVSSSSESGTGSSSSVAATAPKSLVAAQTIISGGFEESLLKALRMSSFGMKEPSRSVARIDVSQYACPNGGSANVTDTSVTYVNCQKADMTLNGTVTENHVDTVTFNEFSIHEADGETYINATISGNEDWTDDKYDMLINGTFEYTTNDSTVRVVFTDYHILRNGSSFTVDGTVSIQNDPNICGANGDYVFQTIVPLTVNANGLPSGTIKVNDDTIVFNGDGTATINGETYSLDELGSCNA